MITITIPHVIARRLKLTTDAGGWGCLRDEAHKEVKSTKREGSH